MTERIFTVPGEVVGKARARVCRNGHVYTPKKTVDFEKKVKLFATPALAGVKLDSLVSIEVDAYFKYPVSWPKWKKAQVTLRPLPKTTKPDVDNILKAVKDALNGIAYTDDSQVYEAKISKYWSGDDGMEVKLSFNRGDYERKEV